MAKKITFKPYFNERLKGVTFHSISTSPLYVQATYARQSIFFKSALFDLYSALELPDNSHDKVRSLLDHVVKSEQQLVGYVVEKARPDFSIKLFQELYQYYSADLLGYMDSSCRQAISVFLKQKKLPVLADMMGNSNTRVRLIDLLNELDVALHPALQTEMNEAVSQIAAFLALQHYLQRYFRWPNKVLTVKDWEQPAVQSSFHDFIAGQKRREQVAAEIEKQLTLLKRQSKAR